jgi:fatty aldehyde-generating acyl-ACP reductase
MSVALIGHLESRFAYCELIATLGRGTVDEARVGALLPHLSPAPIARARAYSTTGAHIDAHYIDMFLEVGAGFSPLRARTKLHQAVHAAERTGASLGALGGFSSIIGEAANTTFAHAMPFTTGNTLTAAALVEQVHAHVAAPGPVVVVGAGGDVGSGVCRGLHALGYTVQLVGRSPKPILALASELAGAQPATWEDAAKTAACVVLVASAALGEISLTNVPAAALVIDAGHPANSSSRAHGYARGGRMHFAAGLESEISSLLEGPNEAHACHAEACVLGFEQRSEAFSRGRGNITLAAMQEVLMLAARHGVRPAKLAIAGIGSTHESRLL